MSARSLPQELIEAIIDHLHYDKNVLQNCSLVSNAWLRPARYHLFYYLKLNDDSWDWDQFSQSRSVALPFVRALSFDESLRTSRHHYERFQADPSFLGSFNNLKSVFVPVLWVSSPFTAKSMQVTDYARITRLKVDICFAKEFAHIVNFICAFSSLETLVISIHRCPLGDMPSQMPNFPRSLHSLGFGVKENGVLEWLSSLDEPPALHTICLSFRHLQTIDEQLINSCLRTLGPTLRAIGIEMNTFMGIGSAKTPSFDLSRNTELRFIHFHLDGSLQSDDCACCVVVGTLSQVISRQVEVMEFTLGENYEQDDTMDWGKVDEMLLAPQFSVLRKVAFGWEDVRYRWRPQYDATWFKTRLPRCHARNILTFPDKMPNVGHSVLILVSGFEKAPSR